MNEMVKKLKDGKLNMFRYKVTRGIKIMYIKIRNYFIHDQLLHPKI